MWALETDRAQTAVHRQCDLRSTAEMRQKPGARSEDGQVLSVAQGSAVVLSPDECPELTSPTVFHFLWVVCPEPGGEATVRAS